MKIEKILQAEQESKRFLDRIEKFKKRYNEQVLMAGLKESGALRRASMDLTVALAEMRMS